MKNQVELCREIRKVLKLGRYDLKKIEGLFNQLRLEKDDENALNVAFGSYRTQFQHRTDELDFDKNFELKFHYKLLTILSKIEESKTFIAELKQEEEKLAEENEKLKQKNEETEQAKKAIEGENAEFKNDNKALAKGANSLIIASLIGIIITLSILYSLARKKEHTSMIGSGSVYNFIKARNSSFLINDIWANLYSHIIISPIEVKSNAAKAVVTSSYQRDEHTTEGLLGIIGMSSSIIDSQSIADTTHYYYALKIGDDPLEITMGFEKSLEDSLSEKLQKQIYINENDLITCASDSTRYSIYATDVGSGTRASYDFLKEAFKKNEPKTFNPFAHDFSSNLTFDNLQKETKHWIVLGSKYYTLDDKQRTLLDKKFNIKSFKINRSPKPLIVYFKLYDRDTSNKEVFTLDASKNFFLTKLFEKFGIADDLKVDKSRNIQFLGNGWGIKRDSTKDNVIKDDITALIEDANYGNYKLRKIIDLLLVALTLCMTLILGYFIKPMIVVLIKNFRKH